jgi:methionyl-tRNA formyltransferase
MKLILMGTPDFVVPIFDAAADAHEVIAVFTRAPKPDKTPVHLWAESRGLPVLTNIKEFDSVLRPDYILVAAYGVILKDNILNAAPCLNIHPSLLPRYRGPSPIVSAIMNGDSESGVCLMKMTAEVDAGDVLMREPFQIGENETAADIEKKVGGIAADMFLKYLAAPEIYPPVPQAGNPTFTKKITSADSVIDWSRSVAEIHNLVRAIGGRTIINGIDVKILKTNLVPFAGQKVDGCHLWRPDGVVRQPSDENALHIVKVQPAGKKPMDWKDFMNGQRGKCVIG